MNNDFFSFFLNNESFGLNTNIFETNIINIVILLGITIYAYKSILEPDLLTRQEEIVKTIENAQKDVEMATNYFELTEKAFRQSLLWLQSWKSYYEKEKIDFVTKKYIFVKEGITENFQTTNNLISNFEKKAFFSLQRYIVIVTAGKILRKFFYLSESEQSKLIEVNLSKLGGIE